MHLCKLLFFTGILASIVSNRAENLEINQNTSDTQKWYHRVRGLKHLLSPLKESLTIFAKIWPQFTYKKLP